MLETFTFLLLCLPQSYPSLHRPLCFLSISPPRPYDITDDCADEGGPRLGRKQRFAEPPEEPTGDPALIAWFLPARQP